MRHAYMFETVCAYHPHPRNILVMRNILISRAPPSVSKGAQLHRLVMRMVEGEDREL